MKGRLWHALSAASICLLGFVAACGLGSRETTEFPLGTFRSRGGRILEFNVDGTYRLGFVLEDPGISGTFQVNGDQITVGKETALGGQNPPLCDNEATYRWVHEGESLSFDARGEDTCIRRSNDFSPVYLEVP